MLGGQATLPEDTGHPQPSVTTSISTVLYVVPGTDIGWWVNLAMTSKTAGDVARYINPKWLH